MKINKDGLHPLYDQYSNEENRLTHALLYTISSSKWLFTRFLKSIVGVNLPLGNETYEISTQKVPFSHGDNKPEEVDSVPDAWIIDGCSKLGIAIEIKARENTLSLGQLRSHSNRIKDYAHPCLLIITPDLQKPAKIAELERTTGKGLNIVWRSWDEVYRWLNHLPISKSSNRAEERFLVASMREYLERRREVLGFQGIYFPKGFNVIEAKAILNAEMEALEPTVKRVYKDLVKRRPAITTFSQEGVWDCFGSEDGFTNDLHITLGINEKYQDIALTVPNSARKAWSRLRTIFSDKKEQEKLLSLLIDLRREVPHVYIEFTQRHFIARRFAIRDGYMEFHVDTIDGRFRTNKSKAKEFPVWFDAITRAIVHKGGINGQVMFKSRFFLNETKGIKNPLRLSLVRVRFPAQAPIKTIP